ncbi:hypothetical protein [Acinetobacter haemolyticus]|uniref:hypothetical protein n=1 Tax=Acinetobacter haemolyticus TaxID=29430 RepID=UPI000303FDE9|nr:hypothetical protein [Acinetobacter haemolyticus]
MTAKIDFFPVDNGDMVLVTLESGRTILIDVNIRKSADDENKEDIVDVATLLKEKLQRDAEGRLYVDAFLLTHPDQDHCRGVERHFHLGKPDDWKNDDNEKIIIREMWSSPIIFRRKKEVSETGLCEDANAWWKEARRRVNLYKQTTNKSSIKDGDRILVLGEDKDGKTNDISDILVKTDDQIRKICGIIDNTFTAWLIAPLLVNEEEAKELTGKNRSSTIIRFSIKANDNNEAGLFLVGGDAEVQNWERVWRRNSLKKERLEYNVLLSPHHCSWHSLSHDSWSKKKREAVVDVDARQALAQAKNQAFIIASSKTIQDDENDPPCIRAKEEYEEILNGVNGKFLCVAEECKEDVLTIEITSTGPQLGTKKSGGFFGAEPGVTPRETEKASGRRYA